MGKIVAETCRANLNLLINYYCCI